MSHQTILVLDFGSQYTQLIARRLRELSVYSEIVPFNTPVETLRAKNPVGIILSGGPKSVSRRRARRSAIATLFDARHAGARHLLRHAADDRLLGGEVAPLGAPRVRPRDRASSTGNGSAGAELSRSAAPSCGSGRATATDVAPCRRLRRRGDQRDRTDRGDGSAGPPASTRCCFIPKWRTPTTAPRSCATSRTASAAAPATGRSRRSSRKRPSGSDAGRRRARSSADSRAASTPLSPRCSFTARSATGSPASSSTTACCATTRRSRSASGSRESCSCRWTSSMRATCSSSASPA